MENLLKVLKSLKRNKSADSQGLIYELFRPEIVGKELLQSLLILCNNVKSQLLVPSFLTFTDITSIYKQKGERCDLDNERGIFGVSKIRSIIDKLVYQDSYENIDSAMSDSNVGGRRKRNIRDNLLVLYATINEAVRNKKNIDIHFYDLDKCFDAMWNEETMNDLYDSGVQNDTFALVSLMNEKCQVKVKTPVGDTERFELDKIEMQGTVLAPLKCAAQIDTLGKYCYTFNTGLYVYRDSCKVPPLGMIDDIAAVAKCGDNSIILNAIVNSRIESKKLQFNLKKCFKMHIGPDKEDCAKLKVHEHEMKIKDVQKYLGDYISSDGKNCDNIKERSKIGFTAISQIKSILEDANFGRFQIQSALLMRDSIFGSKMLLNTEVWHSVTKAQTEELDVIDRVLLRKILDAHCKTGLEWIYADLGKFNLKSLIQIRRMMYLWHTLSRKETELIRRVYNSQLINNSVGDWVKLVDSDKCELGIDLTDREIQSVSEETFKKYVKTKVKIKHLEYINKLKKSHSKATNLVCTDLNLAEYLKDQRLTTKQKQLLFRLRSRTLDVKQNFKDQHKSPWCSSCGLFPETQSHLLQCPELVKNLNFLTEKPSKLNEKYIYGNIKQQESIINIYSEILDVRENLQQNN